MNNNKSTEHAFVSVFESNGYRIGNLMGYKYTNGLDNDWTKLRFQNETNKNFKENFRMFCCHVQCTVYKRSETSKSLDQVGFTFCADNVTFLWTVNDVFLICVFSLAHRTPCIFSHSRNDTFYRVNSNVNVCVTIQQSPKKSPLWSRSDCTKVTIVVISTQVQLSATIFHYLLSSIAIGCHRI